MSIRLTEQHTNSIESSSIRGCSENRIYSTNKLDLTNKNSSKPKQKNPHLCVYIGMSGRTPKKNPEQSKMNVCIVYSIAC